MEWRKERSPQFGWGSCIRPERIYALKSQIEWEVRVDLLQFGPGWGTSDRSCSTTITSLDRSKNSSESGWRDSCDRKMKVLAQRQAIWRNHRWLERASTRAKMRIALSPSLTQISSTTWSEWPRRYGGSHILSGLLSRIPLPSAFHAREHERGTR